MSGFADTSWFEIETCCDCHMKFAMPREFQAKRREDQKTFYCPNGHAQYYTGPTEAQKLKQELERKAQMLQAAEERAATAEQDRRQITKAHHKMRTRVMNGVCPCCNRTFQNLMNHMRTEHPDFASVRTMLAIRQAFGMTQADVAREAGVDPPHVSRYEREMPVSERAKERLDAWLDQHGARATLQESSTNDSEH